MKIIDLLNKIANGEEVPKKIKYKYDIWIYDEQMQDYYYENEENGDVFWLTNSFSYLNDYIGIIEEPKKIEKITEDVFFDIKEVLPDGSIKIPFLNKIDTMMIDKINEIIDKINEGE